jgi:hypothetical protein
MNLRTLAAAGALALGGCSIFSIPESRHLRALAEAYERQQETQPIEETAIEQRHGLIFLGEHTPKDVRDLDAILGRLPKDLVKPVERVYLIPGEKLYTEGSVAEAHDNRSICVGLTPILDDDTVVHELAHQLHFALQQSGSPLERQWHFITRNAKTEYEGGSHTAWKDGYKGPRNGFARAYGASSIYEDIATVVEEVYAACYNKNYIRGKCIIPWLRLVAPEDEPVIAAKLDLAHAYGFTSAADHAYAKSIIGSDHGKYKHLLNGSFAHIFENPFDSRERR